MGNFSGYVRHFYLKSLFISGSSNTSPRFLVSINTSCKSQQNFDGTEKLKWGPVEISSSLLHSEFNRFWLWRLSRDIQFFRVVPILTWTWHVVFSCYLAVFWWLLSAIICSVRNKFCRIIKYYFVYFIIVNIFYLIHN